jgi:hypothetical protein
MTINLSTILGLAPLGSATAWCNFNGTLTGTNAARLSYNVSSVTRTTTGDYTINFTTPFADSNYVIVFGITGVPSSGGYLAIPIINSQNTSSCRIQTVNSGNIAIGVDVGTICLAIFGT